MKFLLNAFAGALIGVMIFLFIQYSEANSKPTQKLSGISSVTKLKKDMCLEGPSFAKLKNMSKVSCDLEFNYYVFSRQGFMHYEYDFQNLKSQGREFCSNQLLESIESRGVSNQLALRVLVPKFYEWTLDVNYVVCLVYNEDFSIILPKSLGY